MTPHSNGGSPGRHTHIAIIGTGFSGLAAAHKFLEQGRNDFLLFESADDVGGCWRQNSYPGIACDVPSNLYSFSFELNPNWSRSYSPGGEIWEYLRGVARKYGILPYVKFNHALTGARWDDDRQLWRLTTTGGEYTADTVIGGFGPLSVPQIPDLPGIEKFKGESWHSQQWNHDYDLTDKRVAVVGTGASALQFVPQIQKQVKELHIYQRTPAWVMPRSERSITRLEKLIYRFVPGAQKLVRGAIYSMLELRVIGFIKQPWLMKALQPVARAHLKRQVPEPELRAKLMPDFTIGCKRILLGNNYYPALRQPNVELITSGVREVTENSVIGSDGTEREVDAIIWGTGFHVTTNPLWDHLIGRDGRSLSETWEGGMRAYKGIQVENFPNLFLVMGPNTGLGHTSMVYMIESSIDYIDRVIRFMDKSGAASTEISPAALNAFNEAIQRKVKDTIWSTGGCASWYLDADGNNTTMWPDFTFMFRRACHEFDPTELIVRDGGGTAMTPSVAAAARA